MIDPLTKKPVDNPHKIHQIFFDSEETPMSEGKGCHPQTGRYLVTIPKWGDTLVARILKGAEDDQNLSEIGKFHENERATRLVQLRTVAKLSSFVNKDEWYISNEYTPEPEDYFLDMPFTDIEEFNLAYEEIEGGVDTVIDDECPQCGGKLVTLDDNDTIPFLTQNFFSSTSSVTGRDKSRKRQNRRKAQSHT